MMIIIINDNNNNDDNNNNTDGHSTCTFRSMTRRFSALKAFVASTRRMPWHSSSLKKPDIAWIAASAPDSWPAHTCRHPVAA